MFCKNCGQQINEGAKFCKFCGAQTKQNTSQFSSAAPSNSFFQKINWSKPLLNRYTAILFGIIFVVWISAGGGTSYSSGTKAPLPTPTQQDPIDDIVEYPPSTPAVSLANGTILKKSSLHIQGYGKLHIDNGTSLDTVAKLIRGGSSVLTVYIKANSSYTMTGISDGVYWLAFAQGLDWDSSAQKFNRNVQYSAFEETFDFETTEDSRYYYYPEFEVTLHPVIGGTAETDSVDPAQFNAY